MKRLLYIIIALTAVFSCTKPVAGEGALELYTKEFSVAGNPRTVTVQFTSSNAWTLESDSDWAKVKVGSGEGSTEPQSVPVDLAINDGKLGRSADLTLRSGSKVLTIVIRQNNKTLSDLLFMTFNVRYPAAEDVGENAWDVRKAGIAAMFKEIKPDIAGFQEPRDNQREEIMAMLGPKYDYVMAKASTLAKAAYNFLAYRTDRFKLISSGYFWLGTNPDAVSRPWDATDQQYRTACWVQLEEISTGKIIWALTTHYPYKTSAADTEARKNASKLIVERMRSLAGDNVPYIMGGDLNCSMYSEKMEALMPLYTWLESARESAEQTDYANTLNGFGKEGYTDTAKIDHIFYRGFKASLVFDVITEPYAGITYLSDHYPCTLYCKF